MKAMKIPFPSNSTLETKKKTLPTFEWTCVTNVKYGSIATLATITWLH